MTDDERERLAKRLENTPLYAGHGEKSDLPENAAAQLRADGERIKALEAALLWCSGSPDFNDGGQAREGWLKLCAPLLEGE